MGFIYRFVFPNGKMYVGQTTKKDVRKRWNSHRARANNCWAVANAIRKYGWVNIKKEVLIEVSYDLLDYYEVKFIDLLGTLSPGGYTLTPGGDFNPMYSEEGRSKQLEGVRADAHREAQARHSREWHKDKARHSSWKAKNTASQQDPENRMKHSKSTKATWADNGIRKKRIDGLKLAFSDPVVSQKRKLAATKGLRTKQASANMMAGHARKREAKLSLLPPSEREKKRKDMEKRRIKAREKYRTKHGITDRVVAE